MTPYPDMGSVLTPLFSTAPCIIRTRKFAGFEMRNKGEKVAERG